MSKIWRSRKKLLSLLSSALTSILVQSADHALSQQLRGQIVDRLPMPCVRMHGAQRGFHPPGAAFRQHSVRCALPAIRTGSRAAPLKSADAAAGGMTASGGNLSTTRVTKFMIASGSITAQVSPAPATDPGMPHTTLLASSCATIQPPAAHDLTRAQPCRRGPCRSGRCRPHPPHRRPPCWQTSGSTPGRLPAGVPFGIEQDHHPAMQAAAQLVIFASPGAT